MYISLEVLSSVVGLIDLFNIRLSCNFGHACLQLLSGSVCR